MTDSRQRNHRISERGFTLVELLLVVLIIGLMSAMAIPMYSDAVRSASITAVAADARDLHAGFVKYQVDFGFFPSTSSPADRALDRETLAPIAPSYFSHASTFVNKLFADQITLYDSPNVSGADTQFWAILIPLADTDMRLLVAHTDQYPGFVGTWFDGVYKLENGVFVKLDE
jgi:prepilin-type N-terminal cleavage/methylation domain-containing protein